MQEYRLDLEGMAAAVTERTRLLFVCNPNNPTGTIVTQDEVTALMERVPDHVLVVFDEAYYDFVDSPRFPDALAYVREGRRNVLVLRTLSKAYGLAGIRLGYGIAHPDTLLPLRKVKEPFAVNLLAQAAGLAALQDIPFLRRSVETNRRERQFLYAAFDRLGLPYVESHTNFVLVHIGPRAGEVVQRLLERGVIVRPCTGYGLPESVRITVGTREQNVRLTDALAEVLRGLEGG